MVEPSLSPVDAARRLAADVRARADEIEQARRLPADMAAALARAGLFRMLVPRALGGGEVDPATMVRAIEVIAAADGSAGWCVTDLMYDAAGGTVVYAASPLGRCFRDVRVATQHAMVAPPTYELTGRLLLGLDADAAML